MNTKKVVLSFAFAFLFFGFLSPLSSFGEEKKFDEIISRGSRIQKEAQETAKKLLIISDNLERLVTNAERLNDLKKLSADVAMLKNDAEKLFAEAKRIVDGVGFLNADFYKGAEEDGSARFQAFLEEEKDSQ